jgi:hypothetical protein
MEVVGLLRGVARPEWYRALCWHDSPGRVVWRADEVELVSAAPVRSGGPLREDIQLSDAWWATFNESLDNLARQRTTRIATPDTDSITQTLVTSTIDRAFPGRVDSTVTDDGWVPAHADLNWSNVTGPECWILDWEDFGLAPRGLDSATLWTDSLTVPYLADRVYRERRADLDTRPGKIMSLFNLAKIVNDSFVPERLAELTRHQADALIADLQR